VRVLERSPHALADRLVGDAARHRRVSLVVVRLVITLSLGVLTSPAAAAAAATSHRSNVRTVLRRALPINRGIRAKKLAGEYQRQRAAAKKAGRNG